MHFTEHHIIYLTFRIILTLTAVINAMYISQSKKPVTLKSFIPIIIAYTLYAGLRWGRGVDYNLYYWVYQDIANGTSNVDFEPLFALPVKLFAMVGLEWPHFVLFMSFFLAMAGCVFLKPFKKQLVFVLPIFFINLDAAENLQRWFMAFSFTLIGIPYLLKDNVKRFLPFALLGFLVHYGFVLVLIPLIVLWYFSRKRVLSPWVSIVLYFAGLILFSTEMMTVFTNLVTNMDIIGVRFSAYQNNAEDWLTGNKHPYISTTANILNIIPSLFVIFAGYAYVLRDRGDKLVNILYHWAVMGVVFRPVAIQIELLSRILMPFSIMQFVFMAYLSYDILIRKIRVKNITYYTCLLVFVYYALKLVIQYPLSVSEQMTYYIWDSHGRDTQYIIPDN